MDLESRVRRAGAGDVKAFVALTRRFQHFAFGSALALVGDFQQAEDVVQEAFLAAWAGLPGLADPAAFPGWLRGIVRHQAFRVLRRKRPPALPLSAAEDVASDAPAPDHLVAERRQAGAVLAAIAALPARLREPATLFYVHDCSQQDIATFLGLSVATVNNRLHAARTQLKHRMLAMVKDTLESHALPDDFANRIGRLVQASGGVVEALFDPTSPPDILSEIAVSDEAGRRGIKVQVIQRPGGGLVRGVAMSPIDNLPRGATVLSSGRQSETPVSPAAFARTVARLAGRAPASGGRIVETGIKVVDVLCPVAAGGTVALVGTYGVGLGVVPEELVRRLSGGPDPVSLFVLIPPPSPKWPGSLEPGFSPAAELKKEGYSEGTVGAVQTFYFRDEDAPWTAERLAALAPFDVVINLTRLEAQDGIYPCVDPLTARSRWLERATVGDAHVAIAERVRTALAALREAGDLPADQAAATLALERARKLRRFFAQPFFCAEPYTRRPGLHVSRADALDGCREILDGEHDDLPVAAFYFDGSMAEIRARAADRPGPEAAPA